MNILFNTRGPYKNAQLTSFTTSALEFLHISLANSSTIGLLLPWKYGSNARRENQGK